jgi:hypothetical protein
MRQESLLNGRDNFDPPFEQNLQIQQKNYLTKSNLLVGCHKELQSKMVKVDEHVINILTKYF